MFTSLILFSALAAGLQVRAAEFVLRNMNYGVNDVFSTFEDANMISLNTGKASAQCNGDGTEGTPSLGGRVPPQDGGFETPPRFHI